MDQAAENEDLKLRLAKAEERLRRLAEVEERLGLAIDIGEVATWDWDLRTGEVTWNARHFLLQGYAVNEVTPSFDAWLARVHPDDRDETVSLIEKARDEKLTYVHDFRSLHATGEVVWCKARGRFFYDQEGAPCRMIGVMEDVTEQRRSEAALREREADLARVQRIGEVGGLDIDVAQGLRSIRSPEYLRLHGLPQDSREESHADWLARVHADDRSQAERTLFSALEGDARSYDSEYRIVRPSDGEVRWIHARADIERDEHGKALRLVGAHIDVTEQRRSTDALRESQARLAAAFESVPAGIAVFGTDGRFVLGNEKYRRFLPDGVIPSRDPAGGSRWQAWDAEGRPLPPENWPSARALRGEAVMPGQEMLYTADNGQSIWTNVATTPVTDGAGRVTGCVSVISDITERKRAEARLRESQERQAFLLALGDAMRTQSTAREKITVAARLIGQRLGASRVLYSEYDWSKNLAHTFGGWIADGAEPFVTVQQLDDYEGEVLNDLKAGRTVRVDNVGLLADEPGFAAIAEVGVQALLSPPLMIDGALAMNLSVHQHDPRHWTDDEVALVQEVAERLWAEVVRARAEAALRESEERFRQFAEASAAGLWIRRADTLVMEYVSPAVPAIYGVGPEVFHGELKQWAALVVPEDRAAALEHIDCARQGGPSVYEFRIQRPSDQTFRWIRNTDFPLLDAEGKVERIGGIVEDVTEAKLAIEHQGVLLAELQHRVRNIMAMIRSMASRSADSADDLQAYRALLQGRLMALARVQTLLTREANAGGSLRGILEAELVAQAHHGGQFELIGEDIKLAPKAVEVLTLAFHELTTNALKYGAFSVPEGKLRVSWAPFERRGRSWMALDWIESGAPSRAPVTRRGFGSDLIEGRIPYELGGAGKITIGPTGAECHLEFPLKEGESILETDAPSPATVFGGALDMTGAPDLTGRTVLVVEDDYYLASDTVAVLRGAGATVLGPCPSEDATLDLLEAETPTHAVLDLNLGGGGPRFEIAHALQQRGVPFIFLTGYDPGVIPADLGDIARLEKPVAFRSVVAAVARL